MFHVGEASERQGISTKKSLIQGLPIFLGFLSLRQFRGFITPNTIISFFSNPLQFFIHVLLPGFLLYLYIFPFQSWTFHSNKSHCTVNKYKPSPFFISGTATNSNNTSGGLIGPLASSSDSYYNLSGGSSSPRNKSSNNSETSFEGGSGCSTTMASTSRYSI